MPHVFENRIKGGITRVTKHYTEANNKYMLDYDEEKDILLMMYLDVNNTYECVLSDLNGLKIHECLHLNSL